MEIGVFLGPVVALVAVVVVVVSRKQALGAAQANYAHFALGPLSQRLGLTLVSGDPAANLMLPPHNTHGTDVLSDGPYLWNVVLQGAPRGRPVDVVYFHERTAVRELGKVRYTYRDLGYVGVQLARPVPDFEVVSRRSSLGALSRKLPLPEQNFGPAGGEFQFATNVPAMGPLVASHVARFEAPLRAYGVHLVCAEGQLRFYADRNHVSGVLYFVESIIPVLEQLAAGLEAG